MSEGSLTICGLGTRPPHETTLETLQALGECAVVFSDVEDAAVFEWLKGYCAALKRPKSARDVVEAARKGAAGLAVWGHPQFSSALARQVQLEARRAKLPFRVLGAISPIGSAFAESVSFLGGDYGYQGIQSYDVETLLERPASLTTRLPLVAFSEKGGAARWDRLFALLRERYGPAHEARLYRASKRGEEKTTVGALAGEGLAAAVVLVPPAA